jgi:hypothetical protein
MQRLPSKVDATAQKPLGIEAFLLATVPQEQRHPEPRHIFRLWQIFVENVNPLLKIIHVPTFQQRIFEVSWNIPSISKPTQAIMFAVYTLAIGSLSPVDCVKLFDQEKDVLFNQYRKSTIQSLIAAELLSTKDVEVLQAFVLFLVSINPLGLVECRQTDCDPSYLIQIRSQRPRLQLSCSALLKRWAWTRKSRHRNFRSLKRKCGSDCGGKSEALTPVLGICSICACRPQILAMFDCL